MSISSEIARINGNIADAYTAVGGKGGTLPSVQNSENLPAAIESIPGGQSIPFFEIDAPTAHAEYGMFWYDPTMNSSRHFSYSPEFALSQVLSSIDFSAKLRGINGSAEEYFNEFRIFGGGQFGVRTDTLASTHKTTGFFVAEGDYIGKYTAPFRGHYDPSYLPDIYDANFMIGFSFGPSEDLWTIRGVDYSDTGLIFMDMEETEDGASLHFEDFVLCKNGIPQVAISNFGIYFTQYFQDVYMQFEAMPTESFAGDLVDFCVYVAAD